MRGNADVLVDVVRELRNDGELVAKLPDAEAIYQGHPTADRGYDVAVVVTLISDGSTPHRGVRSRRYRVQVTVTADQPWREARNDEAGTTSLTEMYAILDAAADVLDVGAGLDEWGEGSDGGPAPSEVGDGRLAITRDWFLKGAYIDG